MAEHSFLMCGYKPGSSAASEMWIKLSYEEQINGKLAEFFLAEFIYLAEVIFSQHNLVLIYKFMYLFNWI